MADKKNGQHIPLPKNTPAFICANCGAVSLDAHGICKPQGRGTKADWCGTASLAPPSFCHNRVNNTRYACAKCKQVSVNPGLLCEPDQIPMPD